LKGCLNTLQAKSNDIYYEYINKKFYFLIFVGHKH